MYDVNTRQLVAEHATKDKLGKSAYHQGPRLFVTNPDTNHTFLLFEQVIARIGESPDYELQPMSQTPAPVHCGGDVHDGRIYFGSGSHLHSANIGDIDK